MTGLHNNTHYYTKCCNYIIIITSFLRIRCPSRKSHTVYQINYFGISDFQTTSFEESLHLNHDLLRLYISYLSWDHVNLHTKGLGNHEDVRKYNRSIQCKSPNGLENKTSNTINYSYENHKKLDISAFI